MKNLQVEGSHLGGPVIRLDGLQGLGLVVQCSSGVLYTNQAGGHSCMQPLEEGVLVPLGERCNIEPELTAFFEKGGGRLELSDADSLDVILQAPEPPWVI